MALATQCPYCNTTFRVVNDQLKLRAGLVRCGSCKQIFNGIEHLVRPDELPRPTPAVANPPIPVVITEPAVIVAPAIDLVPPAVPTFDFSGVEHTDAEQALPEAPAEAPALPAIVPSVDAAQPSDPLQRMTLLDFTSLDDAPEPGAARPEEPRVPDAAVAPMAPLAPTAQTAATEGVVEAPDEVAQAIDDLQRKPWGSDSAAEPDPNPDPLDQITNAAADEPGFVTLGRRRQRMGRILRISLWIGSFILLLGAIGQGTYVFRNQLAAWVPQTKPTLTQACAWLNCKVTLLAQLDAVSIESSELQALPTRKNSFVLTVLLRNSSATTQAWPHIELMLNDSDEKAIARRVFTPQEYLQLKQDGAKGFDSNAEQPVKITFELLQLKASGYRAYLFYP